MEAQDRTTDVLVVGAGLAGFSAAIAAATHGARVLLVEKQPAVGGSTALSGGSFAFGGTDEQAAAGLADSAAILAQDLLKIGDNASVPELVQAYAAHQADTYRWLQAIGVRFSPVFVAGGQSVPRSIRTDPRELMRLLQAAAGATGRVELVLGGVASRLLRDASGAVGGALVTVPDGTAQRVAARRGVVLGTGGFSRSEELLRLFAPSQRHAQRMGGPGNVGDGLRMAWQLGAGMRDMGYIKGTFGSHPSASPEEYKPLLAIYRGAIAVNRLGRRFVNEALSYKTMGDSCLLQPGALAFQVFDQPVFDLSEADIPAFDFVRTHAEGRIERAATLDELAVRIGIEPAELQATVAAYNQGVDRGHDADFGRAGLSNVLDVFGQPLERLYAAGEVVGGLHGAAYMSGSANGKAAIFGRLAGQAAAGLPAAA